MRVALTAMGRRAMEMLRQYYHMEKRISEKEERIQHLFDSATRATPSLEAERVSGSSEHSRLEAAISRRSDLEQQFDRIIDDKNALRFDIQDAIDRMKDEREARLLELKYIDGLSWASVDTRMEISEDSSRNIHYYALNHFAEIYYEKQQKSIA